MTVDLKAVLDGLNAHTTDELKVNPEVVDKKDGLDVNAIPFKERKWFRLDDVVAVVADLKGSTNLGYRKYSASTAAIYEAATGGLASIFKDFGADFVAIQGDGAFGLFWGDRRVERALCAGITIKTFSERYLVPQLVAKWPELPKTGFKVGVAASGLLVKRIGVPRTEGHDPEPVWVGKAVNYAAKCAQQADAHEMIVAGSIWDYVETNEYLAASCPCGTGPSDTIWHDVEIAHIHIDDEEREGRCLTSQWCVTHGVAYCDAVMRGETSRPEVKALVEGVRKAQMANTLRAAAATKRRDKRNQRRGLLNKNR